MDKVLEWVGKLLKGLLPAARRDPVAASLAVLVIVAEIVALSEWQYWVASFAPWDFVGPVFLALFLWRQYRRSWTEASLGLALAILLLVTVVFFAYSTPFRRLWITVAECLITFVLIVRFYP